MAKKKKKDSCAELGHDWDYQYNKTKLKVFGVRETRYKCKRCLKVRVQ